MKKCLLGHPNQDDDAAVCAECGAGFPIVQKSTAAIEFGGQTKAAATPPPKPPTDESPRAETTQEPEGGAAKPDLGDIWQVPDPYDSDVDPQSANEKPDKALLIYEARLKEISESGAYTIGVIGFSSSGKTFFIERLKNEYLEEAANGYRPRPRPVKALEKLEGTTEIIGHRFDALKRDGWRWFDRKQKHFYIVDIPGERFRLAAERQGEGEESESLIRVLSLSDALIVVLAADDVLTPPRTRSQAADDIDLPDEIARLQAIPEETRSKQDKGKLDTARRNHERNERARSGRDRMSTLVRAIGQFAEIARKREGKGDESKSAVFMRDDDEAVRKSIDGRGKVPATFFAIAKADLAISPPRTQQERTQRRETYPHVADCDLLDVDPAAVLKLNNPTLSKQITDCFGIHKIDFVTCFAGQRAGDLRPNYERLAYGITEIIEWIEWARDHSRRTRRRHASFRLLRAGESIRLGWLRFETRIAGWIAREVGKTSRQPLKNLGLADLPVYRQRSPNDGSGLIGPYLKALMDPDYRLSWPAWATWVGALVLAAAVVGLLAFPFPGDGEETYAFRPEAIYPSEIVRMEREVPEFATGLTDRSANGLIAIPSTGGWFSIGVPEDRAAMLTLFTEIDGRSSRGIIPQGDAAKLVERLQAMPKADRIVPGFAKGLIELHSGNPGAQATFGETIKSLDDEVARDQPVVPAQQRRVAAMRIALRNGLGIAALDAAGDGPAPAKSTFLGVLGFADDEPVGADLAAATFLSATQDLENGQPSVARPGNRGDLLFDVMSAPEDRQNMLRLNSATIYGNLLAALIRLHDAAIANGEGVEDKRAALGALAIAMDRELDKRTDLPRPWLQANVQIAAARAGVLNQVQRTNDEWIFAAAEVSGPMAQSARALAAVALLGDRIRSTGSIASDDGATDRERESELYWSTVTNLRRDLESGDVTRESVAEILSELENPRTQRDVRSWIDDAVRTEFERPDADRGTISRVYGDFLTGSHFWTQWAARTLFGVGLWFAMAVALMALVVLLIALWRFRSVRDSYRRLYEPRHRASRLKRNAE